MQSYLEQDKPTAPDTNDIHIDLPAAETSNEEDAHPERVLVVLEMIRYGNISLEKGAVMVGLSRKKLIHLLNTLHIPFEQ